MEFNLKILIYTIGTYGDLHPFLVLATQLHLQNHRIRFVTNAPNIPKVLKCGFEAVSIPPSLDADDPQVAKALMHPKTGIKSLYKDNFLPNLESIYSILLSEASDCQLLIGGSLSYVASLVHEKTSIPWISIGLQPAFFMGNSYLPAMGHALWLYPLTSRFTFFSKTILRMIRLETHMWSFAWRKLRTELDLTDKKHFLFDGAHSPQLELAAFSSILTVKTKGLNTLNYIGFPRPLRSRESLSADLKSFLKHNHDLWIFTLGSTTHKVGDLFYQKTFELLKENITQAALLICGERNEELQLKFASLPNVLVTNYVPYDKIFKFASVVIHQGGIGTLAETMRAGVPSVIAPFCNDQFDNAIHAEKAGVANIINLNKLDSKRFYLKILSAKTKSLKAKELAQTVAHEDQRDHGFNMILKFISDLEVQSQTRTQKAKASGDLCLN